MGRCYESQGDNFFTHADALSIIKRLIAGVLELEFTFCSGTGLIYMQAGF